MADTINKPKIGAIAPWYGGKRTLAPVIVAELGEHKSYWEPACGGMAVLFAKAPSSHETVNDLHGDLTNLAYVVQSAAAGELYDRLQRTLMCEALVLEAKKRIADPHDVEPPDVDRAYWYFLISWAGRNGVSGTQRHNYQMAVRWTSGGGSGAIRFRSAVDSLPWWHHRLQSVEILCRDLFKVLPRIADQDGTAIYLDPPYFRDGKSRTGTQGYLSDFGAGDHTSLAAAASRFKRARVVVSYYDHPSLDELYPGWTKRRVYRNKNLHVQNRRDAQPTVAPEVLLINGPSYTQGNDENSLWPVNEVT